jgi:hypothetical protein
MRVAINMYNIPNTNSRVNHRAAFIKKGTP